MQPFQMVVLHPSRSTCVITGNIIEATAAGDDPASFDLISKFYPKNLFLGLSQAKPYDVGLGGVDCGDYGGFVGIAEIAISPAHDFQARIALFQDLGAFPVDILRSAQKVERQTMYDRDFGKVVNQIRRSAALSYWRIGQLL